MDILITENVDGPALAELGKKYTIYKDAELWKNPQKLSELLPQTRAVIVRNQTKVNENFINAAKGLIVIGRAGIGYDNIDIEVASEKGIVVCYTPEENTLSTAEHTFTLILALCRKLPAAHFSTKQGGWNRMEFMGKELYKKSLGILGLGKIGFRVAMRAKAFGMSINAFDNRLSNNDFVVTESGAKLMGLDELLRQSDIIVDHLPLNSGTLNLLDLSKFQLMKPGALFVNTGRGETVVEEDLKEALKSKIISGAALDVRVNEPAGIDELSYMDNVILTPHIAGLTVEAQQKVVESLAADVGRVLKGELALNFVNFPASISNGRNNGD